MNYEKIMVNYLNGFWSAPMVQMAVKKGVISQTQADAILNEVDPKQALIDEIVQEVSGNE